MILLVKGRPLGSERVKKTISLNPFTPKSDLIDFTLTPDDFTLSNARRFYSSKGDPLGVKGLMVTSSRIGLLYTHVYHSVNVFRKIDVNIQNF